MHQAKYNLGVYCKFIPQHGCRDYVQTDTVKSTLSPEFNFSKVVSIPEISNTHLDWFENGCITFELYGLQQETVPDQSLLKMTTKVN